MSTPQLQINHLLVNMVDQPSPHPMQKIWLNGHLNRKNVFYFYRINILAEILLIIWGLVSMKWPFGIRLLKNSCMTDPSRKSKSSFGKVIVLFMRILQWKMSKKFVVITVKLTSSFLLTVYEESFPSIDQ